MASAITPLLRHFCSRNRQFYLGGNAVFLGYFESLLALSTMDRRNAMQLGWLFVGQLANLRSAAIENRHWRGDLEARVK